MTILIVSSPLAGYFGTDDVSIERSRLERQDKEITRLNGLVAAQEKYARSIQSLILGKDIEEQIDTLAPELALNFSSEISNDPTKEELRLAQKVKDDLRTSRRKPINNAHPALIAPVDGILMNTFDPQKYTGVSITAKKDTPVLSCLAGTVLYTGFSSQDGHVIVIEHADGFVSCYKHAQAVLKKVGDKVQVSDPIAIVGLFGLHYKEPHIQFELWLNQTSVNPANYIQF